MQSTNLSFPVLLVFLTVLNATRAFSPSASSSRCCTRHPQCPSREESAAGLSSASSPSTAATGTSVSLALDGAEKEQPRPNKTQQQGEHQPKKQRVVIVGGGIGGLVMASRIAAAAAGQPIEVVILEKNPQVGGRCGSFAVELSAGTFRHERGPSLLLLPNVYRQIFHDCAAALESRKSGSASHSTTTSMEDFGLHIEPCVPAYKVIFDDGDTIDLGFPFLARDRDNHSKTGDLAQQSRDKMNSYEHDGASKWDEYMRACEAFLDCGLPNFIEERLDLASFPAFLRESLRDFAKAWPLKPHSDVLDAIFDSNKMKALASFQDLYVGLEPYRNNRLLGGGVLESTAPAVFGLLAAIELHPTNPKCGVFAPIGGFQAVTDSLEKLANRLGVQVRCGQTVVRVTEEGVYFYAGSDHVDDDAQEEDNVQFEPADLVIVNADLPYATKSLLEQQHSINQPPPAAAAAAECYDWDDQYRFSCGVISFHWSLRQALTDLNTHNVFMSVSNRQAAEQSWKVVRDSNLPFTSPDDPFNFYVHRASKTDPSAAPLGMDSILVLVPCQTLQRNERYASLPRKEAIRKYRDQFNESFIDKARQAVFKRMSAVESLRDLSSQILDEVVDTPATYADQYNCGAGTPFALSHGFAQLSVTRPGPASSTRFSNVFFCGASTRPGNGVPLVMIGAKLIAEKALSKLKEK